MTGIEFVDWIIGSVVALAGVFGVIAGGMKMMAEGQKLKSQPETPYSALSERVEKLEQADASKGKEISRLRSQLYRVVGVLTREVSTLIAWHESGAPPPSPDKEIAVIKSIINDIIKDTDNA